MAFGTDAELRSKRARRNVATVHEKWVASLVVLPQPSSDASNLAAASINSRQSNGSVNCCFSELRLCGPDLLLLSWLQRI
jgi:hypothetical protein